MTAPHKDDALEFAGSAVAQPVPSFTAEDEADQTKPLSQAPPAVPVRSAESVKEDRAREDNNHTLLSMYKELVTNLKEVNTMLVEKNDTLIENNETLIKIYNNLRESYDVLRECGVAISRHNATFRERNVVLAESNVAYRETIALLREADRRSKAENTALGVEIGLLCGIMTVLGL
ncbi:hypothetical protein Q8F55_007560 [Vanrija albida]|uniref:Uncharacterized protein n=1 Tax=Vanrija albida TaxID=181172 RepID=A0ABR3PTW3_9TREE